MTIHIIIDGKVQGVFFRAEAKSKADKLDIKGWIKNTPDGKVEAEASGSEEHLNAFVEWCKQGPALARVSNVIVAQTTEREFASFEVIR